MSLAAPLFLLAMLAGAIPLVLHLIHRRKAREVPFGTLRFLHTSVRRTRRRKVVDDLALLLVRSGLLVGLALALAGPVLSGVRSLWSGRAMAVAIVLDNSASMAGVDAGAPRFETARAHAAAILDGLRDGDAVALILTGGPPDPARGVLFRRQETVRQALARATVGAQRADLGARLDEARARLARAEAAHKEIYLITDAQAANWEADRPPAHAPDAGPPAAAIPVVVVDVHREPALNVAVSGVTLESPAPTANVPLRVTATVRNAAPVAQDRTLAIAVDGVARGVSPTISLPPGASRRHAFTLTLDRPGVHRGEVRLTEPDGNPLDDATPFAVVLDPQVPVAIVTPRRAEIPYADDAFYLEGALAPAGPDSGAIRVRRLTADELAAAPPGGFAVVFAVNLPAPGPAAAERLRAYVRGGGKLVWIVGDNVRADAYNRMNGLAGGDLLPSPLAADPPPAGAATRSATLARLDAEDPALAPLAEPAAPLQSVLVHRRAAMDPAAVAGAGARVLATLDDGAPLLVSRPVGSGAVLLLATAVRPEWTNLPLKPLFLPLLSRLTFRLAGAEADRPAQLAGTPIALPLPAGGEVEVVRPGGAVLRLRSPDPKATAFRYDDTYAPGVYLLRPLRGDPPRTLAVAATVDPVESDPVALAPEALRARVGTRPVTVCHTADERAAAVRRLREGLPLGDWLLAGVLVALVAECLLANRRKTLPPGPPPRPARDAPPPGAEGDPIAALLGRG
jgi:hypothetical protein